MIGGGGDIGGGLTIRFIFIWSALYSLTVSVMPSHTHQHNYYRRSKIHSLSSSYLAFSKLSQNIVIHKFKYDLLDISVYLPIIYRWVTTTVSLYLSHSLHSSICVCLSTSIVFYICLTSFWKSSSFHSSSKTSLALCEIWIVSKIC